MLRNFVTDRQRQQQQQRHWRQQQQQQQDQEDEDGMNGQQQPMEKVNLVLNIPQI